MLKLRVSCRLVSTPDGKFFYMISIGGISMDSYDNDIFLLFLDDDLFWKAGDDEECGKTTSQTLSEKVR